MVLADISAIIGATAGADYQCQCRNSATVCLRQFEYQCQNWTFTEVIISSTLYPAFSHCRSRPARHHGYAHARREQLADRPDASVEEPQLASQKPSSNDPPADPNAAIRRSVPNPLSSLARIGVDEVARCRAEGSIEPLPPIFALTIRRMGL
jgi:hypothetical protein